MKVEVKLPNYSRLRSMLLSRRSSRAGLTTSLYLFVRTQFNLVSILTDQSSPADMNAEGLSRVLAQHSLIDVDTFKQFCQGFNAAKPLWNIIDCGHAKESADTKLKGSVPTLLTAN